MTRLSDIGKYGPLVPDAKRRWVLVVALSDLEDAPHRAHVQ